MKYLDLDTKFVILSGKGVWRIKMLKVPIYPDLGKEGGILTRFLYRNGSISKSSRFLRALYVTSRVSRMLRGYEASSDT